MTNLHPMLVTGFIDAEGCFRIVLRKSTTIKSGWSVGLEFKLEVHIKDLPLLNSIHLFFNNVGSVTVHGNYARYSVTSVKDIVNVIIPHLDMYVLRTCKYSDFLLFKAAVAKIVAKEHLSNIQSIINIKATLNWGLTSKLQSIFPLTIAVARPSVPLVSFDPYWFAGFVTGDGSFMIGKIITFSIGQHVRDTLLIESFKDEFKCGHFSHFKNAIVYRVSSKKDISNVIIPFLINILYKVVNTKTTVDGY